MPAGLRSSFDRPTNLTESLQQAKTCTACCWPWRRARFPNWHPGLTCSTDSCSVLRSDWLFLDLEDSRAGNNQSESAHTTEIIDVISMECFQVLGNAGTKEKCISLFIFQLVKRMRSTSYRELWANVSLKLYANEVRLRLTFKLLSIFN